MIVPVELDPLRTRLVALGRPHTAHDVADAMRAEGRVVTDAVLGETVEALRRHSSGAGPLEPLLKDPEISDILVNRFDQVYVEPHRQVADDKAAFTAYADSFETAQGA